MYDKELLRAILVDIRAAVATIQTRSVAADEASFFTDSPEGKEKLDSICMLFMAIGEAVKNVDRMTKGTLLKKYPAVDWEGVKGFRDIIAHHYFDIDAEQVFWIVKNELTPLGDALNKMLSALE